MNFSFWTSTSNKFIIHGAAFGISVPGPRKRAHLKGPAEAWWKIWLERSVEEGMKNGIWYNQQ